MSDRPRSPIRVWSDPAGKWATFGEPKDAHKYVSKYVLVPRPWRPFFSTEHGAVLWDGDRKLMGAVTALRNAKLGLAGFILCVPETEACPA